MRVATLGLHAVHLLLSYSMLDMLEGSLGEASGWAEGNGIKKKKRGSGIERVATGVPGRIFYFFLISVAWPSNSSGRRDSQGEQRKERMALQLHI